MTLFATLAAAHWLRTVCNLVAFFPTPPTLGRLRAVGSLMSLLPAVVALVWLGAVVPDMTLSGTVLFRERQKSPQVCNCN